MQLTDTGATMSCDKLCFKDIAGGEVFFDPSMDIPYMKLARPLTDTRGIEDDCNAIDLRTGEGVAFEASEAVGRFRNAPELIYSSKDVVYEK